MKTPSVKSQWLAAGLGFAGFLLPSPAPAQDAQQYRWTVQYLIDNSQSAFGRKQNLYPRNNRALAISPDGKFLYAGYNRSFGGNGELRKIDTANSDYGNATIAILPNVLPKAVTVDNAGRVYLACGSSINVYDATLENQIFSISTDVCEGVAVAATHSGVILYGTERNRHSLRRWEVSVTPEGMILGAKQTGFEGGGGEILIPDAKSLRGITLDAKGRIWLADLEGNQIFRLEQTGKDLKVLAMHSPIALAFDGTKGYVTRYTEREVTVIDDEMNILGTLAVPWADLEIAPFGNEHHGSLAGIAADPGKGFYVSNELGQTAGQRSVYGRPDDDSDVIDGKLFLDRHNDDNEPILHAVTADTPETAPAAAGKEAAPDAGPLPTAETTPVPANPPDSGTAPTP